MEEIFTPLLPLTLKGMGAGGIDPIIIFRIFKPIFVIRNWPVNISKFKYVHIGHFCTLQRFIGFWLNIANC